MFQYLPHVFEQRAWTQDEKQALRDAIQQTVQVRLVEAIEEVQISTLFALSPLRAIAKTQGRCSVRKLPHT